MKQPHLYVLCPDHNGVSGGIKILYRHVDVLLKNSFSASILHQQPEFRCTWFANSTPVQYLPDIKLDAQDFLIIPEVFGPRIFELSQHPRIGRNIRKVIFNQNSYYTFLGHNVDSVCQSGFATPYANKEEYIATIVVSKDSQHYLEYVFPDIEIHRIHNAINADIFSYQEEKKPQICFMPRKHPEDALQVLAILRLRGVLQGIDVVAIDKMNESQVAAVMKESLFFLSFGYPEGFSLPPAEAMACGCLVIGYDGLGGKEYFKPEFSYPVQIGDIIGFADSVEHALTHWRQDATSLQEKMLAGSEYVRKQYSAEREEQDIVNIWRHLTES